MSGTASGGARAEYNGPGCVPAQEGGAPGAAASDNMDGRRGRSSPAAGVAEPAGTSGPADPSSDSAAAIRRPDFSTAARARGRLAPRRRADGPVTLTTAVGMVLAGIAHATAVTPISTALIATWAPTPPSNA